jgi:hypothetical protein
MKKPTKSAPREKFVKPVKVTKPKKKRPGVVSKNNTSNLVGSRNYKKAYKGQGR